MVLFGAVPLGVFTVPDPARAGQDVAPPARTESPLQSGPDGLQAAGNQDPAVRAKGEGRLSGLSSFGLFILPL